MDLFSKFKVRFGGWMTSTREMFINFLPTDAYEEVESKIIREKRKKGEKLFLEGFYYPYIYFLENGLAISYTNVDGEDTVNWIVKGDNFIFSKDCVISHNISEETVDFLMDSDIAYISVADTDYLVAKYKIIYAIKLLSMVKMGKGVEDTLKIKHIKSTEEKYRFFSKKYKNELEYIPLKFVSNYLGVSKETLIKYLNRINMK